MLDIKYIREHTDEVRTVLEKKNISVDIDALLQHDEQLRSLQDEVQTLQAKRNELAKNQSGKPSADAIAQGKEIKEKIAQLESSIAAILQEFQTALYAIPNLISPETPDGTDDSDNVVVRTWGEVPKFDFDIQDHIELGELLDVIDITQSAVVSGSRFNYLKNEAALMQFGLVQFVFSTLTDEKKLAEIIKQFNVPVESAKTFVPIVPPVMIKPEVFTRMARLSEADKDERYYIPADDVYLIGSAEHTLGPLHMNSILESDTLPKRYIGYSSAFRREAGSYGKDVRGILRVHQFDKLEMESFSTPEQGSGEQLLFVAIQEYIMQQLKLPYQVVEVCTGDMGKPDYRQIDIETWIPSQETYRETHSADYMTDYQSRRLKTRVRTADGTVYAHMNDATAIAIGRMIIAILENYQQADRSVKIPEVLQPYVGTDVITPRV